MIMGADSEMLTCEGRKDNLTLHIYDFSCEADTMACGYVEYTLRENLESSAFLQY